MGITIHYHGTVDDLGRIEEMEDRIVDLAFALGGQATVWRSYADHDPTRVVRGLLIDMAPGQETFSLLVSPEGHLTPLFQIEDAEKSPFDEPPYCCVKTQFGSIQGHVAIVHVLEAIQQTYCSNLEVSDESEYYENRDIAKLKQIIQFVAGSIELLADGLQEHGLSKEAAEDPEILASRIERVAILVHQKMRGDSTETQPVASADDEKTSLREPSLEEEVAVMDRLRRKNELRSERMARRIAEATALGKTASEAFTLALQDEGLVMPGSGDKGPEANPTQTPEHLSHYDKAWEQSLYSHPYDEVSESDRREMHPAVEQAQRFLMDIMVLEKDDSPPNSFFAIACRGAMDIVGGLVQATGDDFDIRSQRALAITQLKRALTGHAFARGAIFGLRASDHIDDETSAQLHEQLEVILKSIHELSSKAWDEMDFE